MSKKPQPPPADYVFDANRPTSPPPPRVPNFTYDEMKWQTLMRLFARPDKMRGEGTPQSYNDPNNRGQ